MQRLRDMGASRIELPGIRVEFASASPPPAVIDAPVDHKAIERAAKRTQLDTMYAHVGGWQGTDEELDRLTGFGAL